jgi:hypothetical protein
VAALNSHGLWINSCDIGSCAWNRCAAGGLAYLSSHSSIAAFQTCEELVQSSFMFSNTKAKPASQDLEPNVVVIF